MAVNTQSNLDLTTTSDQVTISYDYIGKFNDRSTLNGPGVIETPTITASTRMDGNVTDILGLGTGDWSTHKNIEEWTGHSIGEATAYGYDGRSFLTLTYLQSVYNKYI